MSLIACKGSKWRAWAWGVHTQSQSDSAVGQQHVQERREHKMAKKKSRTQNTLISLT